MKPRSLLELVATLAGFIVVRDLSVALDLLLRARSPGYAHLGVASIVAIWLILLVCIALGWPTIGRPPIKAPPPTLTTRDALVVCALLAVVDSLFGFRLAHVITGQIPIHLPPSWLSFVAIAFGGPLVEEWAFRGVLWEVVASRTPKRMATLAAAVVTSVLFGASHGRWMTAPSWFTPSGTPVWLHVAFGGCMSVLRWRFRSIGPGLVVHGLWNALYPLTG